MRPNTVSAGRCTTPRHSPVSTITLRITLVNSPKNPFQSPGTHQRTCAVPLSLAIATLLLSRLATSGRSDGLQPLFNASSNRCELPTQPKIPPWALIIASAAVWNSGKYEPTQSSSTRQS